MDLTALAIVDSVVWTSSISLATMEDYVLHVLENWSTMHFCRTLKPSLVLLVHHSSSLPSWL